MNCFLINLFVTKYDSILPLPSLCHIMGINHRQVELLPFHTARDVYGTTARATNLFTLHHRHLPPEGIPGLLELYTVLFYSIHT